MRIQTQTKRLFLTLSIVSTVLWLLFCKQSLLVITSFDPRWFSYIFFLEALFGVSDSLSNNEAENKNEDKGASNAGDIEKDEKGNVPQRTREKLCYSSELDIDKVLLLSKSNDSTSTADVPLPKYDNKTNQDLDDKEDDYSSLDNDGILPSIQVSNSTQSVPALLTSLNKGMNDNKYGAFI